MICSSFGHLCRSWFSLLLTFIIIFCFLVSWSSLVYVMLPLSCTFRFPLVYVLLTSLARVFIIIIIVCLPLVFISPVSLSCSSPCTSPLWYLPLLINFLIYNQVTYIVHFSCSSFLVYFRCKPLVQFLFVFVSTSFIHIFISLMFFSCPSFQQAEVTHLFHLPLYLLLTVLASW